MMSVATTDLSRSTQHLIDSRLDTIDRMLLGRVSRQERLEIVREVEAQIFEQLRERGADEFGREDVLAVLGRLDPPEAYLPDEEPDRGSVPFRTTSSAHARRSPPVRGTEAKVARISGILGMVALALITMGSAVVYGLLLLTGSEVAFLGLGGGELTLSFLLGFLAITLAVYSRQPSLWAIVGLVSGILSILACFGVPTIVFLFS
jgi:hypothetical protein